MRTRALALALILLTSLVAISCTAADVNDVTLNPVGDCAVSGKATTIVGEIGGSRPYRMMEVNMRMDQMPPENMVYEGWLVDIDTDYKYSLGAFNGLHLNFRANLSRFEGGGPYEALAVSTEPVPDSSVKPTTVVALGSLPGSRLSAADFLSQAVLPADEMFQRQVAMQRFGLDDEQATDLRMRGFGYGQISVMANAASRCNKMPGDVARMLEEGQSWSQVAQACNITVAQLLEPVPLAVVAGFRAELPAGMPAPGMVTPPMFYQRMPNGKPVITRFSWDQLRKRGYNWRNVAIAANITAQTGESVDKLLRMTRIQGQTWRQIAVRRALDVDAVTDVSGWPFSRNGEEAMPGERPMMAPPPAPPVAPPPGY